jgi:redox-sensitive bicupin YhaK (pirin superfamily)
MRSRCFNAHAASARTGSSSVRPSGIRRADALVRREPGAEVHLYSGRTGVLVSPTRNRVPVTLVDVSLAPGAEVTQTIPASYAGFLYVLDGEAHVGPDAHALVPGQIGWLEQAAGDGDTEIRIANHKPRPMRVLLYAGQRQDTPIAW